MNIVIADFVAGFGGHSRTAVTIAEALHARGHVVRFLTGPVGAGGVLAQHTFQRVPVELSLLGRYAGVKQTLTQMQPVDVVHIYSETGVAETVSACKELGIPCFRTICGGKPPSDLLPMGNIISLSEEVKHGVPVPSDWVHVLPGRIDTRLLRARFARDNSDRFAVVRKKYGISRDSKILLRIARLAPPYEQSIVQGARAVAKLRSSGLDVRFLCIGFSQMRAVERRICQVFDEINSQFRTPVAIWAPDEADEAVDYVPMADVVIGTGRAAFEGMLAERPTIVVGPNGFGGVVDEESVSDIAWYNFSGRNQQHALAENKSVGMIADAVRELIVNPDRYEKVAAFSRAYVERCLDVEQTVPELERLYRAFHPSQYPTDESLRKALRPFSAKHIARRYFGRDFRYRVKKWIECLRIPFAN